ncbi:hypothetical protein [Pseudoblastomonas halimionae]|uniref:Uncharacterized protein n=1 Tax=Alteriqipengyuania halimionae TaxID=1926630 RepID=A0A6I4U282_9SPHN|nr:hypothetical protein [Alteriqipengyuania halimionae]MXP08572.1 hypothetical protein [Alteriqipengyuania halimionae]
MTHAANPFAPPSIGIIGRALRTAALALSIGCTALPVAAFAQENGADESEAKADNRVVIRGRAPLTEKETKKIANRYVRELTIISGNNAVARYEREMYCPAVIGLSDDINRRIAERMRLVAEVGGVQPAEPGCPTSALVFFVDDKTSFLSEFRKAYPEYFQSYVKHWKMPDEEGPAIAWTLWLPMVRDGMPPSHHILSNPYVSVSEGGTPMLAPVNIAVMMAVVVIERDGAKGFSTDQLADYAVMRTLTDRLAEKLADSGAPTILTVLSTPMGEDAVASVTAWDLAYIKARYSGDPRLRGNRVGSSLKSVVFDAAEEEPAEAPERED